MQPKVKRVVRDAQVLSGAKARYVSLVNEGANETAFTVIKAKNGDKSMAIKQRNKALAAKRKPVAKSHKPLASAAKKEGTAGKVEKAIAKFEYSTKKFKTEKSVRDHLAGSDWEGDVKIAKQGDVWVVTPVDVNEDELLKIAKVNTGDDGVSAFIGIKKLSATETKSDDNEDDDEADVETKADDEDEDDDADEEGDDEDESDDDGDDEEADESDEDEDEDDTETKAKGKKKPMNDGDGADSEDPADASTENGGKKGKAKKQVKLSKRALAIKKAKGRVNEKKFSFWDAYNSGSSEFSKILKSGMDDGVPPGMDELMYCLSTSVRNTLAQEGMSASDKRDALEKSAAAFSDTVAKLDELFDSLVNADSVSKVVKADEVKAAEQFIEKYADYLATEPAEEPKAEKKAKGKTSVAKNGEPVIDYKGLGDLIQQTIKPLAEKVEKMASAHPTSKSAKVEEGENTNEDKTAERKKRIADDASFIAKKAERGIFGI